MKTVVEFINSNRMEHSFRIVFFRLHQHRSSRRSDSQMRNFKRFLSRIAARTIKIENSPFLRAAYIITIPCNLFSVTFSFVYFFANIRRVFPDTLIYEYIRSPYSTAILFPKAYTETRTYFVNSSFSRQRKLLTAYFTRSTIKGLFR